ncbi:Pyridoxal phosphate (PLP)-dependent transferases superfamily protein [Rhynchospora pubera]|uniref:Pyridoxal phosphate (PLP)-dependent transferases superfamily protein n=1 Tax=Rhynchospora pubera TaxID=906938 RepID=A0AAV8ETY6_9POAL|nr:Pyridoxal phosphate (PLP)-dependent transferases superfamily protein [Rhynchospora pubera]
MEPKTSSADEEPSSSANGHSKPDLNGPLLPLAKRPRHGVCVASEFAHHETGMARLNNGSFGSCPASVLQAQAVYQRLFLAQPDKFYFDTLQPALERSRRALMPFIGLKDAESTEEVALVDNATTAAAIVLQHMAWQFTEGSFQKGDVVLMLHYAYGAVTKSIHAYVARAGAQVIEVPLPFPLSSPNDIIREFRNSLRLGNSNGRRVRLAVIDHITSMPCVVVPVRELVQICREEGVDQVFIDAAHAIGNVEVDVEAIGADFYTSNLHKWFFCPPAVAFLHSRKGRANSLHHPVVSHEYGNGLPMESGWIGTRDYSSHLVVPEAIDFVNKFEGGIEGIRKRNHEKVVEMGRMLAQAWGTDLGAPPEMSCSMVMVGLPGCLGIQSDSDALKLRALLREEYKVEVPIYYNSRRKVEAGEAGPTCVTGYARISHQVYNVEAEYFRLRDAVIKLVNDGFKCAMLSSTSK